MPSTEHVVSDCCIVGGGPAGLMLGYLLARAGLQVVVLEKHADFLRDFRGDTIHPSTLEVMHQLGLLDDLLKLPHQRAEKLQAEMGGEEVTMADFSRLPLQCRFIAFMPQWDFLNFLAEQSAQFPGFTLLKSTSLSQLIIEEGEVRGVLALQSGQPVEIRSRLVVGADGRNSAVRAQAGLVSQHFGSPRDVLWFRLNKQPEDPQSGMGHTGPRNNVIVIDRGDYWQCGLTIEKGQFDAIQARGLDAMKHNIATVSPFSVERLAEIDSWEHFKLLSIRIDRLNQWAKPGVLCIGDAAHAMSPIGGVGVNLAIQDAVATANLLTRPLLKRMVTFRDLKKVQQRRQFPTVATQFLQIKMSSKKKPGGEGTSKMPGIIRKYPFLRFIFGRLIGMGFRMEKPRGFPR
ncbi:FAD-dependent oxidoreductase [Pantoea ananatis]|uniref:FAD-dependent oxidoreductase n=1 Tax=Pantoea ananas TaxID=553 RepID=UPI002079A434|nr:FAD-dependent oxidoreductase [Pantoea ananatis]MCW0353228.1 6-methylpretetramide 4-monooxygenase [Pantoea ananatis]USL56802.1 FAD-dependent oxidoreductase [Pantoea ananatis]